MKAMVSSTCSNLATQCTEQRTVQNLNTNGYPTKRITVMKKKAKQKKDRRDNQKWRYGGITIPYMEGLLQEVRRKINRFEIPVSFKPYTCKMMGNIMGYLQGQLPYLRIIRRISRIGTFSLISACFTIVRNTHY